MRREIHGILKDGERIYLGAFYDDKDNSTSQGILEAFTEGDKSWFNIGSFAYKFEYFIGLQITPNTLVVSKGENT